MHILTHSTRLYTLHASILSLSADFAVFIIEKIVPNDFAKCFAKMHVCT